MKKNLFIKIMLVVVGVLLLLNLFIDILPVKLSAKAIKRYKVERVTTQSGPGAFSQLWVKMNDIMNSYKKGSLVSVVKHSSTEKEAVWYLIVKAW